MYIQSAKHITPIETPHGENICEYFGQAAGGTAEHSLAQIILPPLKSSLKHYHPLVEESYYILAGEGRIVIDDEQAMIKAGDAVAIPINAVHQIFNESGEDLIFLAICAPAWTADCSVFVDE
jgi:mannose-6-phosphate isomerase-like protein (cupin superfamily)